MKRRKIIYHVIAALAVATTLSSCAILGNGNQLQHISNIHQGQTHQEVTTIMKKEPDYRRFAEDGLEQWEYHKNFDLSGDYDVILIGFRDGRVVSMDSFRYIRPTVPTIEVQKQ
mgnify:CR=1 FL=1|jgi:hypothetical protein